MSNILQGKEEYFTLIQKYSHYQPVGRMIEYNQIKGKGGERAVSEYVLELKGITKIFPGVKALNNVQFQLKPGEVHALMGENGAGKSTFIKVITGVHKAEEGEMFLNGQKVDFKGPKDAQEAGIAAVYQHPTSYPHLTVAENIFMGHEIIKHHMIQWKEMNQEANKYLGELDADFDATAEMGTLSVAQQQMVEIAKALMADAKVIIMDEPTAALTQSETRVLFEVANGLREKGVSIVYISHRMEEIFELCDRITILRDGTYIDTKKISETDMNDVVKMMIGREIGERYPQRNVSIGDRVLEVKNLTCPGVFEKVSFEVHAGEVLGVSGLMGAGRTEIMQAIFGNMPHVTGEIFLNGKQIENKTPKQAMKNGIGFITEDRKVEGLMLEESIMKNISLANLKRISRHGVIQREKEKELVKKGIEELHIRCFGPQHECNNLSGGNQQKVCLAKAFALEPKFLFVSEPTRGIDIGAKKLVLETLVRLNRELGMTVVIVSSELQELKSVSDRIAIVSEGKLVDILSPQAPDADYGLAMSGIKPSEHIEKGGTEE